MSPRDAWFLGLGWQLAIAFRFAADFLLEQWDRRKACRALTAQTTETP